VTCNITLISVQKLRQEVFVWQGLENSHILPLYGIAYGFDIVPALVCPWMKKGSLHHYLNKMWGKNLPPEMQCLFLLVSISFLYTIDTLSDWLECSSSKSAQVCSIVSEFSCSYVTSFITRRCTMNQCIQKTLYTETLCLYVTFFSHVSPRYS
jgi:hypothetical protein